MIATIIKDVASKIGVTGIIIVALFTLVGWQYQVIKDNEQDLIEVKVQIKTQSDAIRAVEEKRAMLQDALNKVVETNKKISKEYDKILDELTNRPIALTCDSAIAEVSDTARKVAERWNK